MKNQYFGDNRDLFKYDLIQHISTCLCYSKLAFIPMLTPNDHGNDGNLMNRNLATGGRYNQQLIQYLDYCIINNRRNIKEIISYFEEIGIETYIHREDGCFSRNADERMYYFGGIPEEQLNNALIFVDPDNGFQIGHSNEKHFLFSEAESIIERMNDNSLLMAIQFRPFFEENLPYIQRRFTQIQEKLDLSPVYITDNQITFFFLTRDSLLREKMVSKVAEYREMYFPNPPDLFDNV